MDPEHAATTPPEPEIWVENTASYRAFWALQQDRTVHFGGLGSIPLPAILAYSVIRGLDAEELFSDIRAMDAVFLEWSNQKQKEEREREKQKADRESKRPGGRHGARR